MENILVELIKSTETELETIRSKATLFRDSSPGHDAIMERVDALEARLAQLQASREEISQILKNHKLETIRDLVELRRTHENTIIATGNRVWMELTFVRGQGKTGESDRTRWLPSDLIKAEGFPTLEAQARKQIEEAKAALPKVIADLKRIETIVQEA